MENNKYLFFYGHKPNKAKTHYFSQWCPAKFTEYYDEKKYIIYQNAEQYMMAHKALLFNDPDSFDKIIETSDPAKIKNYGRKIKNFDQDTWDKYKFDIVIQGNRLKFKQNPKMMARLLETNNKIIVEASPYDKIWGIGLRADQAINIPEKKWPGQNLLGKALMIVRDENKQ